MEADLSLDRGDHTRADWEKAAAAVLRKSGRLTDDDPDGAVWEALTQRTADGIAIQPLGDAGLAADLPPAGLPGQPPFTRGTTARRSDTAWDIRAVHSDPDPARTTAAVLDDLQNGVTSVWLTIGPGGIDRSDLPAVLGEVLLDLAPVVLDAPGDPVGAADALGAVLADRGVNPAPGTNFGADPVGAAVRAGRDVDAAETRATVGAVAERATRLGTYALVVDGTAVHDAGASDAQELAYTLATGAAYLRDLVAAGHTVDEALALVEFRYAATAEQFTTIAKLRAARRLWHRVAELSGAAAGGQVQHAVTSRPMMSRYDPYVNMLRTTVAAFAAGVGGATSVTVLPFDAALGMPDGFARRIARNTSSLLIAESHVAAVTDAAGGAYAVERLTDDLARAAWEEFGRTEEAGGIAAALSAGTVLDDVGRTAADRARQVATRRRPLTGVSEFPNLHETLPTRRPYPEGTVHVSRYAAPFEALRDQPAAAPVFLATMGTLAAHTGRATFAANLFASGGIDTVTAGATDGVDAVLRAYDGSPVVCLTGTDDAYASWGADLAAALRDGGARHVVLAGAPPEGVDVDDSAATGGDALAFLRRTREHLSQEPTS